MPNSTTPVSGLASLGEGLTAVTQGLQGLASQQGSTLYFDYQGLTMFPAEDVRTLTQCVKEIVLGGLGQTGFGHGSLFLSVHSWPLSVDKARVTVQFAYTATSGPTDLNRLSSLLKEPSSLPSNEDGSTVGLSPQQILSYFAKSTDADCLIHRSPGEGAVLELSVTLPHEGPEIEPAYLIELATVSAWLIGAFSEEETLLAARLQRDGWFVRQFANVDDALAFWAGNRSRLEPALVIATNQRAMSRKILSEARHAWTPQCRVIYGVHEEDFGAELKSVQGVEVRKVPFSPADLREIKELASTLEATRNKASQRERRDDSRTRPTALVVDDNLINRVLAAEMLHVLGFESDMAENGREAVEYMERYRPDVVLMDVDMPVMDGIEATERIRRYEAHDHGTCLPVPIIATTARDEADISKACEAIGMTALVPKPLLMGQLAAALPHPNVAH